MLKKNLILVLFFIYTFSYSQIKEDDYVLDTPRDYSKFPAKNANYIELLGNGGLYSVNFDRIFLYKEKIKISGRGGFSVFPVGYKFEQSYIIENNYIFLSNPHHIEIGPGLTLQRKYNPSCTDSLSYKWESVWFGMFRLGYRFQKQEDGFFFRAALLPILYRKYDCGVDIPPQNWFWCGVAAGVSF